MKKILRKLFQFFVWLSIGYLTIPVVAFALVLILSFLFWFPVPFDNFLSVLNPVNHGVMRFLMLCSFVFALIMTIKYNSIKEGFTGKECCNDGEYLP